MIPFRLYARVDLGILSDITEMHQTTEQRQEKLASIRSQLEEQISNMENFIFRVASRNTELFLLLLVLINLVIFLYLITLLRIIMAGIIVVGKKGG